MRRIAILLAVALGAAAVLTGASLGGLFQKAKSEFTEGKYGDAWKTLEELKAESQKPENAAYRSQLAPALAFYRGATLAALGKSDQARLEFEAYLALQPNASIDPKVYPKKVVAAFEKARKAREKPAEGDSSIAAVYRAFPAPEAGSSPADERWAEGPVQDLLTSKEKAAFAALADPASRARFIEEFWKARDSKPETPDNEFRREFERRAAFADLHFAQGEKRGSLTDRGMVFILLGPPTYVGRKPLTSEDAAGPAVGGEGLLSSRLSAGAALPVQRTLEGDANWREVWHYRRELLPAGVPYQQVDFEFVTKKGYGKDVLQRDSAVFNTLEAAKRLAEPKQ